jgi:hypothetical protein
MLTQATQALLATVHNPDATGEQLNAAAQAFFQAAKKASREEANNAVRTLSACFDLEDSTRAAMVALICGALVEHGCDPEPMAAPLTNRLTTLLEASARFAQACRDQAPQIANQLRAEQPDASQNNGDAHDENEENEPDPHEVFELAQEEVAPAMPQESLAWAVLRQFWQPAIAVYSVSPQARAAAQPLRSWAAQIADHHEGGHWLQLILSVLDNEPLVVIELATGQGILGKISGVVDNFQLNTLLMDAFPRIGWLSRRRVSQRVADVARGKGPQKTNDTVTSVWNLYTWKAVKPDLTLPDPNDYEAHAHWIWNEGSPEDIPVFEGRRAVLLGPPSYPRSWGSQRMFTALPADLVCEKTLSKDEVKPWLQRMAAALKS